MLNRMEENWFSEHNRFDRPEEKLIGTYADGLIVVACGLNIDPLT